MKSSPMLDAAVTDLQAAAREVVACWETRGSRSRWRGRDAFSAHSDLAEAVQHLDAAMQHLDAALHDDPSQ